MIDVRCFHHLPDAADHGAAMDALNLASAGPDPFSTYEFFAHCMRNAEAFPDGIATRPWLLLAFDDQVLIGYAALKQSQGRVLGFRASRLGWLTAYVADRPHVVARADDTMRASAAILAYLLDRRSEWSLLEFEQQDAASVLPQVAAAQVEGACRIRHFPNMSVGVIALRWSGLAGYFAALPRKSRSNVGRQMRGLLVAGDVQLLSASTPAAAAALFELYRHIEPHSWKGRADLAIGSRPRSAAFLLGLMEPAQPMRVVVQVLLLDGMPIAGLIGGLFGQGLYAMHIVYDERRADLGAGSAILLLGIRLAIDSGAEFVNLQWGSGHYKTRWLADMHETQSLQVYRVGTPYHWRRVVGDVRRRVLGAPQAAAATFNPVRRALPARAEPAAALGADPSERATVAGLVDRAHRAAAECLCAAELAAAMSFATRLPA